MIRNLRKFTYKNNSYLLFISRQTFLTNEYNCKEAWKSQTASSILEKINLHDFYNILDQNYTSKGIISAIDVDVYANAVKDPIYLEELKDLLHKLRLSAETGNTLHSTHHATIRNYIEFGNIEDLINILKNPLNFGVFLDDYTANILLNKLITSESYEQAANVASLVMLQEEYTNDITCTLCQYATFKYIMGYLPPESNLTEEKKEKIEEVKVRIKFLRNPYYDDHFDMNDTYLLAGKTLAWISDRFSDNISNNLQIIGWLAYKKYDKLLLFCEQVAEKTSSKIYVEVIELLKRECCNVESAKKTILENCIAVLTPINPAEVQLEKSLKIIIENAINKSQKNDILRQQQLFQSWVKIREIKLEEQTKRLDRIKRMQTIQEKQNKLQEEEQKLWFFENEEKIDLEIEEKEKLVETPIEKKSAPKKIDENYIPPEILPKRK